jgi:DNA-binding MarR family transcriptional regulator
MYICMVMKLEEAIGTANFSSPEHKAVLNVLYTAWWLRTLTNQSLKKHSLTHEQYNVLRILRGRYPQAMCVKDIGSRVIEKSSNVPRIIDRLVAKKMVKRTQGLTDKRETLISLTTQGTGILAAASQGMERAMKESIKLNGKDAVVLNNLLEMLRGS